MRRSSMISLHSSTHSSQIYPPGPAMSCWTCFCLLPQNVHVSRFAPSPIRATAPPSHVTITSSLSLLPATDMNRQWGNQTRGPLPTRELCVMLRSHPADRTLLHTHTVPGTHPA